MNVRGTSGATKDDLEAILEFMILKRIHKGIDPHVDESNTDRDVIKGPFEIDINSAAVEEVG